MGEFFKNLYKIYDVNIKMRWIKAKNIILDEATPEIRNVEQNYNEIIKFLPEVMLILDLHIKKLGGIFRVQKIRGIFKIKGDLKTRRSYVIKWV